MSLAVWLQIVVVIATWSTYNIVTEGSHSFAHAESAVNLESYAEFFETSLM
jgi:hypothetical protein